MKEPGRKNLYYSLLLAAVMMMLLIGYFIWMLPSLYVSYTEEQNLKAIRSQHQTFLETGTYEQVHVRNPTACMSIKIPFEEAYIEAASKMMTVKITPADAETADLMKEIRSFARTYEFHTSLKKPVRLLKKMEQILKKLQLPVQAEILYQQSTDHLYDNETVRVHTVDGHGIILETTVSDQHHQYTNYLAMQQGTDAMVFSVLPVVTPQMEEIRPVVMQSVPMLGAVLLFIVLIFSQLYSAGIVHPMYQKLLDMNQSLLEENERQEMFLRASSHQLKTPVTAALLLLDGIIGGIGKYKDYKKYLPKVKEQLLSMRSIIEEILSLHKSRKTQNACSICLYDLVRTQTASYQLPAADRHLEILLEGSSDTSVWADCDILSKIIDNLLANAVAYTPHGGRITIFLSSRKLVIRNDGITIPQDILPHIFEPFVCGEHQTAPHGLGLYIAAYYAKMMSASLEIRNLENSVEAVLVFHPPQ